MSTDTTQWSYVSCPICEANCGLRVDVDREKRQLIRIEGDPDDVRSKGYLCPKSQALKGIYEDPNRLRRPIRKCADGSWQEISWDEAIDFAVGKILEIREQYGHESLGVFAGNPLSQDVGGMLYSTYFLKSLMTTHVFSGATIDHFPKLVSSKALYGRASILPIPDIDHCDYFVCVGGNPYISNGSLMGTPNIKKRLKAIQQRGGKIIVIDPRKTETAKAADQHLFIRPGTDAYLLFAIVNTLFEEQLIDPGHLLDSLQNIDQVATLAAPFTPELASEFTGIDADDIRQLTREFAGAGRAAFYGRLGTCTVEFGTLCCWLIDVIGILTGHFDAEGGMMFPRPPTGELEEGPETGEFTVGRWHSAVRNSPEIDGQLSCALMAEEIDSAPDDRRIRAMVTIAGNPVLTTPASERLDKALAGLDFMVSFDIYLNETTRHADLILPNISHVERENFDMFTAVASRNYARYSPQLLPPEQDAKPLWEILFALAARLNQKSADEFELEILQSHARRLVSRSHSPAYGKDLQMVLDKLGDVPGPMRLIDLMLRAGPYGDGFDDEAQGLSLEKVKSETHGLDLGAMQTRLQTILRTPGRKIDLAHPHIIQDIARLQEKMRSGDSDRPLLLIGRRQMQNMNSHLHNLPMLAKGKPRCTLMLHSDDADTLGLKPGDAANIRSNAGQLKVDIEIDNDMMPGTVSLPHGYGHTLPGIDLAVAQQRQPGVNANVLTDEQVIDVISGTCVANGIPVSVSAVAGR